MTLYLTKINSSALAYTSHPYSGALAIQPSVLYIPYDTSYHEQTGYIINFAQIEEGGLVENECNVVEYESILASIDELSKDDGSDDGSISMNTLGEIWGGNYVHPDINTRDARLKIRDRIMQVQS